MAVQDTFRTYNGNGLTTDFAIPFTYELPTEVKVTLDGVVINTWTFVNPSVLRLSSPLLIGSTLTVERVTNIDSPAVVWKNGSGTTGGQLNAMVRQLINSMQEARDTALRGLFRLPTGVYDFVNSRAVNLGDPTDPSDAATKSYVDALVGGAAAAVTAAAASAVQAATSAATAVTNAATAVASALKAQQWADNDANVQVETGKYSAKHWAALAQTIAGGASASATPFTPAGTIAATNVQTAIQELDTETNAKITTTNTNVTNLTNDTATNLATKASKRNRVLNSAFQISQEFGADAALSVTAGTTVYICDGWQVVNASTGALVGSQQAGSGVAPSGSPYRLGVQIAGTDTSVGSGDLVCFQHPIEGLEIADLQWGTASAKAIAIRFYLRSSVAGTFGISLANSTGARSYVTTVTVSAGEINTDKLVSFVVPGDTSGTWPKTNTVGLLLRVAMMAGTTWQTATTGAWQVGNFASTSAQTNVMATNSASFGLADVGLWEGSTVATFQVPGYADELRRCMRYWQQFTVNIQSAAAGFCAVPIILPVTMRTQPTLSFVVGSGTVSNLTTNQTVMQDEKGGFYQGQASAASGSAFGLKYNASARL